MLSINIIGAGRLGKTLGKLLVKFKVGIIQAVCNTNIHSSQTAINDIGEGSPYYSINNLPPADITLIATSDHKIEDVANILSQSEKLKPESIIFHCSGALSSQVLAPLKSKNCFIASVHPMHSFANPELSCERFNGTYCAIEGDQVAFDYLKTIFARMGAISYKIDTEKKHLYHAAGVVASNYLVTLCEKANNFMVEAGVDHEISMRVITSLMLNTAHNLSSTQSTTLALTGPIQRGDVETITHHMQAMKNKEQKELYSMLGLLTLKIAQLPKKSEDGIKEALLT